MVLESERLKLIPITETDLKSLFAIFNHKGLTQYFVSGSDLTIEASRKRLSKIVKHWQTFGFGDYLFIEKCSNCVVGYGGLHYKVEDGPINISYLIHEEKQGLGYGKEASKTLVSHGFETLKLQTIYGEIDPKNKASIALIEKSHFKYEQTIVWKNHERLVYTMTLDRYQHLRNMGV